MKNYRAHYPENLALTKILQNFSKTSTPRMMPALWIPSLYALLPEHNGFLRFTSGATPADLLAASMAAEPFSYPYLRTILRALFLHFVTEGPRN